mmetsp:Transcript_38588/g.81150  ORF Transcript_38588/g.81150 Transcript_38588/m.81150 type:complete len:603 (+) Transcript_38588:211-2019(+)
MRDEEVVHAEVCGLHETSPLDKDIVEIRDEVIRQSSDDDNHALLQHNHRRGGAAKRKRFEETKGRGNLTEQLHDFQHSSTYLRIPASSVAALCGLHPFQNLPQLLFDLVYQSYLGQTLLQRDAKALGLTLVDAKTHERETMLELANAASKETQTLVKQVLEVSDGKRKLQSVEEVQSIQKKIRAQATKAQEKGKLSKKQMDSLVEASRGHVSTGFGTCHEDEALDVYEQRTGCVVRERNEALMEWRFQRVQDVDGELGVSAAPLGEATRRVWGRAIGECKKEESGNANQSEDGTESKPIEIDDGDDGDDCDVLSKDAKHNNCSTDDTTGNKENKAADGNGTTQSEKSMKIKPFFRIVGAVDGIRDELYSNPPDVKTSAKTTSNHTTGVLENTINANNKQDDGAHDEYNFSDEDDDDQWTLRPIIVECKHRMAEAKVPPPLYDQIQTCLYCHMYNVEEADLIQVVRRRKKNGTKNTNHSNGSKDNDTRNMKLMKNATNDKNQMGNNNINITITRISLHDPIHNHNHHWRATLLPRIASFVDAVYNVRRDDGKRYRLLMSLVQSQKQGEGNNDNVDDEEECWKMLWEECPWLLHCDTAYRKRRF